MPYWRLSAFYLFHFASLGALLPYWSLYLKDQGFDAVQIGELMALFMATKIIAPNLWGWVADHSGRRMRVVRAGALLGAVCFIGVFFVHDYWPLALVMFLYSFFWNAVLPQFEATTLSHLGPDSHRYSSIRLWGSIGFIATVAGIGAVLDHAGTSVLPPVLLLLFAGIWLATLVAPDHPGEATHAEAPPLRRVLRRPPVVALLAVSFLMQASHGPYYTFFTIYLGDYGYSHQLIGWLWALGVIAEVGIFMLMPRLVSRFGLQRLLLASFALTTLRWLVTGYFPQQLWLIVPAQTLHAASFGIYHAVVIALFHHFFRGRHQGKGQALYSSLSFGAGGAFGSYYSGLTWESLGPAATYTIAAAMSLAGLVITWRWLREAGPVSP